MTNITPTPKNTHRTALLLAAAAIGSVGLATVSVSAQNQRTLRTEAAGTLDPEAPRVRAMTRDELRESTEEFVSWAADSHLYAIEAAEIALEQEGMPRVQEAARMLKADHETALQMLKGAVRNFDIDVQDDIEYDVVEDTLENLEESEDDRDFAEKYLFTSYGNAAEGELWLRLGANQIQAPGLKDYAGRVADVLETHQSKLKELSEALIAQRDNR